MFGGSTLNIYYKSCLPSTNFVLMNYLANDFSLCFLHEFNPTCYFYAYNSSFDTCGDIHWLTIENRGISDNTVFVAINATSQTPLPTGNEVKLTTSDRIHFSYALSTINLISVHFILQGTLRNLIQPQLFMHLGFNYVPFSNIHNATSTTSYTSTFLAYGL